MIYVAMIFDVLPDKFEFEVGPFMLDKYTLIIKSGATVLEHL
jgi:hypothetical protein